MELLGKDLYSQGFLLLPSRETYVHGRSSRLVPAGGVDFRVSGDLCTMITRCGVFLVIWRKRIKNLHIVVFLSLLERYTNKFKFSLNIIMNGVYLLQLK